MGTAGRAGPAASGRRTGNPLGHPVARTVIGLVFTGIGLWFLIPTIGENVRLEHGIRTVGVIHQAPEGYGGDRLWVRFQAAGRPVLAELPRITNVHGLHDGSTLPIRYQAGHPERVAAERDLGPGSILVLTALTLVGAVNAAHAIGTGLRDRRRRPKSFEG